MFTLPIPPQVFKQITAETLKADSPLGYKLGYVGSALLIAAQAYTLRIRTGISIKTMHGEISRWLTVHCYLSLTGAVMILIHSGFPLSFTYANVFRYFHPGLGVMGLMGSQGLVAWLTLALAISGFFGRYLYRKLQPELRPWFRSWLYFHFALSGGLYVSGISHFILAVFLRHVTTT